MRRSTPVRVLAPAVPAIFLAPTVLAWGCGWGGEGPRSAGGESPAYGGSGTETVGTVAGGAALDPPVPVPPALATIRSEPVVGWVGPGGRPFEVATRTTGATDHLFARFGSRTLPLPARASARGLTQYPCASCHLPEGGFPLAAEGREAAHPHITPTHPTPTEGACETCHSDPPHRIRLPSGGTVSIDHAYRLCAQCHAPQVASWAGGAHGKRLVGWAGPRVVMGCADCHDPHRPAVGTRIPYPGPRVPRDGRHDR